MSEKIKSEYLLMLEKKKAGDELDRLAVELAARDGVKYSQAFQRVAILNPELVKQYRA